MLGSTDRGKELEADVLYLKGLVTETLERAARIRDQAKSQLALAKGSNRLLLSSMINFVTPEQFVNFDPKSQIEACFNRNLFSLQKLREFRDTCFQLIVNLDQFTIAFLKKPNMTMPEQFDAMLLLLKNVRIEKSTADLALMKKLKRLSRHRTETSQPLDILDSVTKARILVTFYLKWLIIAETDYVDKQIGDSDPQTKRDFVLNLTNTLGLLENAAPQARVEYEYLKKIELYRHLLQERAEEPEFQRFFEENPDFLSLQIVRVFSKKSFAGEQIPDLVLLLNNGHYVVIELEKPVFKLYTQDGNPTRELSHAEQQVRDYLSWALEEKEFLRKRGLTNLSAENMTGLLIIGADLNSEDRKKLEARNNSSRSLFTIKTFSDVLDENIAALNSLRKM